MSASLVGSEMCIRDRSGGYAERGCAADSYEQAACNAAVRLLLCARRWPVSYTHLTLPTICSV
eukprot:14144549-Alexandrium_andersonii.AAC.1